MGDKESACQWGSVSRLGKSPGERNGNPLQYSCLGYPIDREAWWATVHGVTQSRTRWACMLSLSLQKVAQKCWWIKMNKSDLPDLVPGTSEPFNLWELKHMNVQKVFNYENINIHSSSFLCVIKLTWTLKIMEAFNFISPSRMVYLMPLALR